MTQSLYAEHSAEKLVADFVAGDEQAFLNLVERHGDRLFGFICRFVGDYHLAEDVYQAVLVKVAKNAGKFDGRSRFATWMYRIARNCCIDAVRKRAREKLSQLDENVNMTHDESPSDAVTMEELGARIGRAVDNLPEEQREVFLLKEEADLTFEEVGNLLDIGKETAKSRMRYALDKLREALGTEAREFGLTQ